MIDQLKVLLIQQVNEYNFFILSLVEHIKMQKVPSKINDDFPIPNEGQMYIGSLFGYFFTSHQSKFDRQKPYLKIIQRCFLDNLNLDSQRVELHPTQEVEIQSTIQQLNQQISSSIQIQSIQKITKTKYIKKTSKKLIKHKTLFRQCKPQKNWQNNIISVQSSDQSNQSNQEKSIIDIDSHLESSESSFHSEESQKQKQRNNTQLKTNLNIISQKKQMFEENQQNSNNHKESLQEKKQQFVQQQDKDIWEDSLFNCMSMDQIYQNPILLRMNCTNYQNFIENQKNKNKQMIQEPKTNFSEHQKYQNLIYRQNLKQKQSKTPSIIDFNVIFKQFWQQLSNKSNMVRIKVKVVDESKKSQKGYYVPIRIDIFLKQNILNQFSSNNYYNYEKRIKRQQEIQDEYKNARQQLQRLKKQIRNSIKLSIPNHKKLEAALYKSYVNNQNQQINQIKNNSNQNQLQQINQLQKIFEKQLFKEKVSLIKRKIIKISEIRKNKKQISEILKQDKNIRLFLIYLINKLQVKKINHSFIKPKTSSNSFIKQFKKLTFGINKRSLNWDMKYKFYMQRFVKFTQLKPISMINQKQNYYQGRTEDYLKYWEMKEDPSQSFNKLFNLQVKKQQQSQQKFVQKQYNKIQKLLGLSNSQQHQLNQTKALNQKMIKHFETQNIHFKQHPNPTLLKATLKPYQRQGLTWLKFRQGKIKFRDLFEQEYMQEVQQLQFQRKLSPFWQQVQLIGGQRLYLNYLTGQFTKQFHEWGAIKGGILADEMGLGKTIMMLSLLADDQFDGTSLIVVPVSVLKQWKEEIKNHINEDISVFEYHNNARKRNQNLMNYKIIITTYATLSYQYHDYQQQSQLNTDKYLFDYKFKRVILDEAHNIRNQQTRQSQATLSLKGDFKWCLTGTLIQNSIEDLFSIFRFLNLEVLSEPYWWNKCVVNAQTHDQMLHTIYNVLRPVLLRRNKQSVNLKGQIILQLPQKIETIIQLEFSEGEQKVYQMLKEGIKEYFYSIGQQKNKYFIIFQIINRLRQFCIHPSLIFQKDFRLINNEDIKQTLKKFIANILNDFLQKNINNQFKQQVIKSMVDESHQNESCVICYQVPTEKLALTKCGHLYCLDCIEKQIKDRKQCAVCRTPLKCKQYFVKNKIFQKIIQNVTLNIESSKTKAIFKKIQQIYQRNQKCVIFTHFLKLIDYIKAFMKEKSIGHAIINGGMDVRGRSAAVTKFRQDDECMFMIVSINAGGTGINLTMANNVMICDPWWNPSIEDQAYCRVHRIGQTKTVNVYKFIIKNSIQENILKMHDRKRKLASEVMMMKTAKKQQKLKINELIKLVQ